MKRLGSLVFHIIGLGVNLFAIFTMFFPLGSYLTADNKTITLPFLQAIFGGTYSNNGVSSYFNTCWVLVAIYAVLLIAFLFSLISTRNAGIRVFVSVILLAVGLLSIFTTSFIAGVNPQFVKEGFSLGLGPLLLIICSFVSGFCILLTYAFAKGAKNSKK